MSSILKALRKLEEEKSALGEGGVDIARDILKRSARKQGDASFWPALSAVLFLLLIGTGAFFWSAHTPSVVLLSDAPPPPAVRVPQPPAEENLPVRSESASSAKLQPPPAPAPKLEPPTISAPEQVHAEPEALHPNGLPFLKLTGIAYREKSAERMAIINDLPVMQGTAIEGAELVEILPDRVVLSWRGALFDLQITSEN